jgi:hypothetical protein
MAHFLEHGREKVCISLTSIKNVHGMGTCQYCITLVYSSLLSQCNNYSNGSYIKLQSAVQLNRKPLCN